MGYALNAKQVYNHYLKFYLSGKSDVVILIFSSLPSLRVHIIMVVNDDYSKCMSFMCVYYIICYRSFLAQVLHIRILLRLLVDLRFRRLLLFLPPTYGLPPRTRDGFLLKRTYAADRSPVVPDAATMKGYKSVTGSISLT